MPQRGWSNAEENPRLCADVNWGPQETITERRAGLEWTIPKVRLSPQIPIAQWPEVLIPGSHSSPDALISGVWAPGNGTMDVRTEGFLCPRRVWVTALRIPSSLQVS